MQLLVDVRVYADELAYARDRRSAHLNAPVDETVPEGAEDARVRYDLALMRRAIGEVPENVGSL